MTKINSISIVALLVVGLVHLRTVLVRILLVSVVIRLHVTILVVRRIHVTILVVRWVEFLRSCWRGRGSIVTVSSDSWGTVRYVDSV